ncbi:hypothetical protein L227DRAFT_292201 [Lentinus tigrinus ALCF2SS1-6]|uniref:Uncharacterized protein n=1 Tax=Lentinus tigrinus ALCF2SS1-6 TaxID=1328759 RepID=A0A5C2RYI6_9APHY|nr:hypothetical protein L227DRAFT_292201 [Lentinus tigrinus ALCF2SS1-6]
MPGKIKQAILGYIPAVYFANTLGRRIPSMKKAQRRRRSDRNASAAKPGRPTTKNLAPRAPSKSATSQASPRALVNGPWSPPRLTAMSESSPAYMPSTPSGNLRIASMHAMASPPLVMLPFSLVATIPGASYAMRPPTALQWWVPLGPANSPQCIHSGTASEFVSVPAADASMSAGPGYAGISSNYGSWYAGTDDEPASPAQMQERRGTTMPSTVQLGDTSAADAVYMQRETQIDGRVASSASSTLWSPVVEGCWRTVEDAERAYACIKGRGPATVAWRVA